MSRCRTRTRAGCRCSRHREVQPSGWLRGRTRWRPSSRGFHSARLGWCRDGPQPRVDPPDSFRPQGTRSADRAPLPSVHQRTARAPTHPAPGSKCRRSFRLPSKARQSLARARTNKQGRARRPCIPKCRRCRCREAPHRRRHHSSHSARLPPCMQWAPKGSSRVRRRRYHRGNPSRHPARRQSRRCALEGHCRHRRACGCCRRPRSKPGPGRTQT